MSALSKIVSRAKQMRKARPNKHRKWTAYVKDAAKEYKAGGPKKRKAAPKKVKARKKRRSVSAVSSVGAVRKVRRRRLTPVLNALVRRRKPRRKAAVKRRRVGNGNGNGNGNSTMKSLLPVLLIGGGLAVAYMLMKKNSTTPPAGGYPPLINTANPQRNQTSQNILNYAMAAGLTTDAILKLISALNHRSDADVQKVAQTVDSGGGIPDWILYGY